MLNVSSCWQLYYDYYSHYTPVLHTVQMLLSLPVRPLTGLLNPERVTYPCLSIVTPPWGQSYCPHIYSEIFILFLFLSQKDKFLDKGLWLFMPRMEEIIRALSPQNPDYSQRCFGLRGGRFKETEWQSEEPIRVWEESAVEPHRRWLQQFTALRCRSMSAAHSEQSTEQACRPRRGPDTDHMFTFWDFRKQTFCTFYSETQSSHKQM